MTAIRSQADLVRYINEQGLAADIIELEQPTRSVEAAARAVGAEPEEIVKTVVFMAAGTPVLALGSGTARLDGGAIAAAMGVQQQEVRLARREEVLAATGYEAGAVPPIGHPESLDVLCDRRLSTLDIVFAGGGSHHALLRIRARDVVRLTGAVVLDLLER